MRKIYIEDDEKFPEVKELIADAVSEMDVKAVSKYEYGDIRANTALIREYLEKKISGKSFHIDTNRVEHAYDIGNNNEYPLVFHKELSDGSFEEQTCGYLELNSDVYTSVYLILSNIERNAVYQRVICPYGVRMF